MTPWTVTRQAPLSVEFSSQDYWCGLPFPSPDTNVYYGVILQIFYNVTLPLFIHSAGEEELSISSLCQLRTKMNLLAQVFWYS